MKFFSSLNIKEIDAYTIAHEPIASIDLMERAAEAMTYEIMARYRRNEQLVIFCGPGNNGGDGLAIARLLSDQGYRPEVYLFNPSGRLSADCQENKQRLTDQGVCSFIEVESQFLPPQLTEETIVIDALFGTGLKKPLGGGYAMMVEYINSAPCQVVSIDVPSGLFTEDNGENIPRAIIEADFTLTLQFPKLAFLLPENERYVGEWKVLDIGLHPRGIEQQETNLYMTEMIDVAKILLPRGRFVSKHDMGHGLIVAGSYGMIGAVQLAARAAMHSGAGLITVHIPSCGYTTMQTSLPEVLCQCDSNDGFITNIPISRVYTTIAVGPGLGRHPQTMQALSMLIDKARRPMVVDADALNLIAQQPGLLGYLPPETIITPHIREFDRMFGRSALGYDRLQKAAEVARRYNLIIVLKGCYTAIVTPDGNFHFNSTGNPGMATAGAGDVLTGILTALLCRGYEPINAARLGVYWHGLAGDLAVNQNGQEYITASEIIAQLGRAYQQIKEH